MGLGPLEEVPDVSPETAMVFAAVVGFVGLVSTALMTGMFNRGNHREDRLDRVRDTLIDNLQEENTRLRAQNTALGAKVAKYENRPHRSTT